MSQAAGDAEFTTMLDKVALPGYGALLKLAGMLGESLKIIAWPYPLHLYYHRPSTLMSVGYLALHLVLLIASLIQLKRKHYGLAVGLIFFYIAMLPASRVISAGGSTSVVTERYLYFHPPD